MKPFLIALQFLTILPIRRRISVEEKDLGSSLLFFPLIGLLIGGLLVIVSISLEKFLPFSILNLMLFLIWIWITGALHLDGFVDTVDGISGGKTKEEILKIMEDSSVGAKGMVALVSLLLAKFLFLLQLHNGFRNYALFFVPALGRWAMVLGATFSSYAKENGLGKPFVKNKGKKMTAIITSLLIIILGLLLFKVFVFYLLSGVLLVTFFLLTFFKRKINGITGDSLGAINEIIEAVSLLIIIVV